MDNLIKKKDKISKSFINPGANCTFMLAPMMFFLFLFLQIVVSLSGDPMTGAGLSFLTAIAYLYAIYFMFFNPRKTYIKFNKEEDSIKITYKLFFGDRQYERIETISNVKDVKARLYQTNNCGECYELYINFKDESDSVSIWMYDEKEKVQELANEITILCLGLSML